MDAKAEGTLRSSADVASNFSEEDTEAKYGLEPKKDSGERSASSRPHLEVRRIPSSLKYSSLPIMEKFGVPSFNGVVGSSTSSSWLELKDEDILIMRVKTLQNNCDGEKDVRIPKHEAVCKFCFDIFENDNVLKTKCKCKFTLIHEDCAIEWSRERGNNKCNLCDQDIQNIPVTLSRADQQRVANPIPHPKRKRSRNWLGCFKDKV